MASGLDIASRARAEMQEIGGRCGNNNKYTHWYSDNVDNIGYNFWWCAAFVSYHKYYSWHCGDGRGKYGITNSNSVGVEICINADGNRQKALKNTAALVRELMSELNIPIERVVRHYDASRKNCPASMSKNGWSEWYEFKEMLKGGDLTMTQYEELKAEIAALQAAVNTLQNKMIYNYIDDNMPSWARPTIQKMVDKGLLQGDENGCLGLTDELLRIFVTNDRSGMYDHRWDGKSA